MDSLSRQAVIAKVHCSRLGSWTRSPVQQRLVATAKAMPVSHRSSDDNHWWHRQLVYADTVSSYCSCSVALSLRGLLRLSRRLGHDTVSFIQTVTATECLDQVCIGACAVNTFHISVCSHVPEVNDMLHFPSI